jgi:hypothetical protein
MQPKNIKAAFVRGKRAALSKVKKENPYHYTQNRPEHEAWTRGFRKWSIVRQERESK